MTEQASLSMRYVARPVSDNEENRWLRLEQLLPEDESLSVADAAKAIDALFNIEPCDQGLGGGGKAVIRDADGLPANQPPEERLEEVVRDVLGPDMCNQAQHWIATVLVLRSHQQPGYTLRSEDAEVLSTELIEKEVTETLEMNGATSKDLSWPYVGGLSTGLSSDITAKVLGSTINLSGPVERLNLRYRTRYEQLRIRVPVKEKPKRLEDETLQRPELPAAAVVAFWADLAAACELKPPPTDERSSQGELDRLCRGPVSGWENITPKECWQTLEHYQMCNCSKKRINVWREVVPVTCPDGADASSYFVSNRSVFDGYVTCPDEEDEVNDPEYYEQKCCVPPPRPLPRCRKTYSLWRGGAEIEGGPQRWLDIYGPGTRLIPVAPKAGICGELVTEWEVDAKNCCDDVPEMQADPDNPAFITAPSTVKMCVEGGRLPIDWRASAGYVFDNGLDRKENGGQCEWVTATASACNHATINVADGCSTLGMQLSRSNPRPPMEIFPDSPVIAPGNTIILYVESGQGPYEWAGNGLELLWQGGNGAGFRAPADACGSYHPTVSDVCSEIATGTVLATQGYWKEVLEFDPCSAPWGGSAPARSIDGNHFFVDSYQGWRAAVSWILSPNVGFAEDGCPHKGSCAEAVATIAGIPCGYTGDEMIVREDGSSVFTCTPGGTTYCYPLCRNHYQCYQQPTGPAEINNQWAAGALWITQLWKWTCAKQ